MSHVFSLVCNITEVNGVSCLVLMIFNIQIQEDSIIAAAAILHKYSAVNSFSFILSLPLFAAFLKAAVPGVMRLSSAL